MNSTMNTESMNIVIVGHVDHGKSTIIGRLLADTHSLPLGKLDQVRESCRRNAKPFEYAFLLDALKDEQAQGITIDAARCFFKTAKRQYIIIDAPGHIEFLKNMVTGAARAEAALLVIDADEGIQENTKRHGYLLSMLGVRQITVLVNKMDLAGYDREIFDRITAEYSDFLGKIGVSARSFIPVSGVNGDNVAVASEKMTWYQGKTVLDTLDDFTAAKPSEYRPFRMPVQSVYKFTGDGDDRRIIAGTVDSGSASVGDEVVFYPSGKKSRIRSFEVFNRPAPSEITAGFAAGFTLAEQIYIRRGEIAAIAGQIPPRVTTRIKVSLFWLGKNPLDTDREYVMKLGTSRTTVRLGEVLRVMDASSLENKSAEKILRNEVADCILNLDREIAFDAASEIPGTGRFVLIDRYEIAGGGIISEALEDKQTWIRNKIVLRNDKWEKSGITCEERAARYRQKAALLLVTGQRGAGKKTIAKALEKRLFEQGRNAYFLGIGNVLYGVDADIKSPGKNDGQREEHLRRLSEIAHLMLDAGSILIVTAVELTQEDIRIIHAGVNPNELEVIWIGEGPTTDIRSDLHLTGDNTDAAVDDIVKSMYKDGILFDAEGRI